MNEFTVCMWLIELNVHRVLVINKTTRSITFLQIYKIITFIQHCNNKCPQWRTFFLPECSPIRIRRGRSGMWWILNRAHSLSMSSERVPICPAWSWLRVGRPLQTMYASPIVSTCSRSSLWHMKCWLLFC